MIDINLGAGANTTFSAMVEIPLGAPGGDSDMVTVTATSQGDISKSDAALLTTTVTVLHGVNISPDEAKAGSAGQTIYYTMHITNTGNVSDTFDLMTRGNTWTTTLSTNFVTLPAGQSQAVTIQVTIPAGAVGYDRDVVTITAVSRNDGAKSDAAVLTTTAGGQPYKIYLPLILTG